MSLIPGTPALHEVAAPAGWTALLLQQDLPVDSEAQRSRYAEAVAAVLQRLPVPQLVPAEEVLLLFERLRPAVEIPVFQNEARQWMPEFGMGVWLHGEAPTTWTTDEFLDAPTTLRPVIERVVRVARNPQAQRGAWDRLLGSGALLRTLAADPTFLSGATEVLKPTIADRSLTSFPFYLPLLRAGELQRASPVYDEPLEEYLPGVYAYLRESVEDGGLLLLLRQPPDTFWKKFGASPLPGVTVHRSMSAPS
ncbi:MAG: hypothetical protein ACRYGF_07285 [Janthinobacterium lividum]